EELAELEPNVVGLRALHSPDTGIVDFSAVAACFADEIRRHGGDVLLGQKVCAMAPRSDAVVLETTSGAVTCRQLITCPGLDSDRVAQMTASGREPCIVPFRGDYWLLRPERRGLVKNLIYPVPDPELPFLGVHFTRRIDGAVWLGPNAVLAFAREGYRRHD